MQTADDKQCYRCGKVFKTKQAFARHRARKIPCGIRDVTADQLNNPNHCKYCNTVLSNKCNLTKHIDTSCKIKNGGADMFADKIVHEQMTTKLREEIRLLRADIQEIKACAMTTNIALVPRHPPDTPVTYQHHCVYLFHLVCNQYKYGMTKDIISRGCAHRNHFKKHGCNITLIKIHECVSNDHARAVEASIEKYAKDRGEHTPMYGVTEIITTDDPRAYLQKLSEA